MDGEHPYVTGPRISGSGGTEIATYHLGGEGEPLILMHATGFHGRCWLPLAASFTDDFSVWAIDQRGHGASGKSADGYDWDHFTDDLLAVVDGLGGGTWSGVGHSLGGGVLVLAAARAPDRFASLCLYEPVVLPKTGFGPPPGGEERVPPGVLARKRRTTFASRQAAYDNYASKPPFNRFDPRSLWAYVEYGLVDQPDGTVTLACRREDEAAMFDAAVTSGASEVLGQVRIPVAVFAGGDGGDPVAAVAEPAARRLPRGGFRRFDDLDHFGPFEAPELVGEAMARALTVV